MSERRLETSVDHEVPFHDIDITNRVWHGHYYKYLELARTALFRRCNLEDRSLVPGRFSFYVIETRCRYVSPLRYGERIRISAWFRETERRLSIAYEITNLAHERRAARGLTALAIVDVDGTLRTKTPEPILERILHAD